MENTGNRKLTEETSQASLPKRILQREPTEFFLVEKFSILKNSIVPKLQLSSWAIQTFDSLKSLGLAVFATSCCLQVPS